MMNFLEKYMNKEKPNLVLQVSEFNEIIKAHLESLGTVTVEGEISQISISQNKWIFLTIKDKTASVQVFAIVYQIAMANTLEEGMKVLVTGKATLYQKTARFSIFASKIIPAGEGALRLAYEKLKSKLAKEGLFDVARKRKISRFPETIGLITGKSSRAYGDFIKVLKNRLGGLKIYFYPVQVQGEESVASLLKAFDFFNQANFNLDAIVLTRGGGSLEDLISFNDELVARAVFSSKFPVVSAIGHEDDTALTDYVADLRASTPSNAAELLVETRENLQNQVDLKLAKMNNLIQTALYDANQEVDRAIKILLQMSLKKQNKLTDLFAKLRSQLIQTLDKINFEKSKIDQKTTTLTRQFNYLVKDNLNRVFNLERLLANFDIKKTLQRGFSINYFEGKVITDASMLQAGNDIKARFYSGEILAKVHTINKENHD